MVNLIKFDKGFFNVSSVALKLQLFRRMKNMEGGDVVEETRCIEVRERGEGRGNNNVDGKTPRNRWGKCCKRIAAETEMKFKLRK